MKNRRLNFIPGNLLCLAAAWLLLLWSGAAPAGAAPASVEAPSPQPPALRLLRNVMTIRLNQGFYEMMELYEFENKGPAAVASQNNQPTIRLPLPRSSNIRNPDVTDWTVGHGLEMKLVQRIGNEIVTTEAIPVGRKMVAVLYRLQDEYGGISIEKPILYGTENFVVLPEKGKVEVEAALTRAESVTFQEKQYDRFVGSVQAGRAIRLRIQAPASTASPMLFLVVGGSLCVIGGGMGLWYRKRRKKRSEREDLLREIARLDDRLAGGEISPAEHRTVRAPRFARLRELSR